MEDVFILPLSQVTQYTLFTSSVDYVGNRKPLNEAVLDFVEFDFPIVIDLCINNCSGNGNCTLFGNCLCEDGYFGNDCSQSKTYNNYHCPVSR